MSELFPFPSSEIPVEKPNLGDEVNLLPIESLIEKVKEYLPDGDFNLIRRAYRFAQKAHSKATRKSGEPYITHPFQTAAILVRLKLDEKTIAAGLLHDCMEDAGIKKEEIEKEFGPEIADLVEALSKIKNLSYPTGSETQAEYFKRMIFGIAKDVRVILIKLADRLHNMRTLQYIKEAEKREKIARETLEIYAPFANRLGIGWIKAEMEDLAFKYLYPEEYKELAKKVASSQKSREEYIAEAIEILKKELKNYNIEAEIKGRAKHLYSIYQKIHKRGVPFEEIYDLMGIRVITRNVLDCFKVYGVISTLWKPIPGKFKNYISLPKNNMYQSLHLTVIGPKYKPLEIQIRTAEMDLIAEEGIAAHWVYKEGLKSDDDLQAQQFKQIRQFLGQLYNETQEFRDPRVLMEALKKDLLFPETIYVFTPKGELKELPKGSTMVDFAYSIHSEIGNTCVGAKVNGKMVPLDTVLKTGDRVEILTSKKQTPSSDWLKFVVTQNARSKIQAFLRNKERDEMIKIGRELLTNELKKHRQNLEKVMKNPSFNEIITKLGFQKGEDLFAAIGFGRISAAKIHNQLISAGIIEDPTKQKETAIARVIRSLTGEKSTGISIGGMDDVASKIAGCCNPVPGDDLVGFITRGRGLSLHRKDCPNIVNCPSPERLVEVEWKPDKDKKTFLVQLYIQAKDRTGLAADICKAIADTKTYIESQYMRRSDNEMAEGKFIIAVESKSHLDKVVNSIKKVKGVVLIKRL